MLCPKCKNSIPNNVLRCPHCSLKVRIVCPECKTVSLMGKKFCSECGFSFFKACPNCGAMNISTAKACRKCKENFLIQETSSAADDISEKELTTDEVNSNVTEQKEADVDNTYQNENAEIIENDGKNEPQIENVSSEEPPVQAETYVSYEEGPQSSEAQQSDKSSQNTVTEEQNQVTDDGFMISSDDVDINEDRIKDLIEKVEELDKTVDIDEESKDIIQQKFESQEKHEQIQEEEIPPEYVKLNQQDAQNTIINAIQNPVKRIISLNGKEGYGKSLILKYVRESFRKENYIWAMGECNALTQITPFGYIQDVLLNLFNLSNFTANVDEFRENNSKALHARFFNLNNKEVDDLVNFLYPAKTSEFNGILRRKEYTIEILKKVFENLSMKSMVIFVVDDFENIDGASFDFLKDIISDTKFEDRIKLLITNKNNKIAQGYFYGKALKSNYFTNIFLSEADRNQCVGLVNTLFGAIINLPESIENQLFENSKGTIAYIEQACLIMHEIGVIIKNDEGAIVFNHEFDDYILPHNVYRIIEERLNLLGKDYPVVVKALYYASILGNKFSLHQFENVVKSLNITKEDFSLICNYLQERNYITRFSENFFTFNNTLIWHYIYERAKADENFAQYNKNIYSIIEPLNLSNNSIKPILLQNLDELRLAYVQWQKNSELASYLGDTNLYVISLKQQLKISNNFPDVMLINEKISIFEKLGKILYKQSPKEAVNYLSAAIAYYKEESNYNPIKIIELSGFLTKSCLKSGDYHGVIESCDVVLNTLPDNQYMIEKAVIASKKLPAILYLGNCEEVINIANTELLEVMEIALAKSNSSNIISDLEIFEAWIETSLNLAVAYALQSNKKAFDVISKIDDALISNKIENEQTYIMSIMLTRALAHTIRGEAKLSSDILSSITAKFSTENMQESYILRWNLINIINKIISKDYHNIVDEMFQVATFADNISDLFTKNILKLLLGYIIQTKSKNINKAEEIYNEEIVFFSKEKIATGALLSWYLISSVSIVNQGPDFALDVAIKALDVAKSPKINNYTFIVAFKLLIAEMYMLKRDLEAVKMYLEKAMIIAKNQDLKFMQMLLYQAFGKYNEEMITAYPDNAQMYANSVSDMYKMALNLSQTLVLNYYENLVKKDIASFKAFCQLKNIQVIIED